MSMYTLTDREVKKHFEQVYPIYKDYPSYSRKNEQPKCLVCQSEARITWECECGVNEGIFDEDDPQLSERQQAWKERV
ncbi:hypothetical protein PPSC2_26940 (plasmid) [Paenibacillus polymyxa SC2]|uniref:Uncharacterized protein n=2 Tax=Paenibacillus polymyxa TaxID=1406 RepID=E3EJP1_PAEPS|nr:hypothetical protein PPSC2_26940 [Paenibacillus polymyxa SC2]